MTLCAQVNRDNAPVQWRKEGKKIRDDRFHATSDGRTHYLTINYLKKSDSGEYECDVGTDKAWFSVQVKGKSVPLYIQVLRQCNYCEMEKNILEQGV